MHAMIIDDNKAQRESMTALLQRADHRVTATLNQASALSLLERDMPDVIIVSWGNAASDIVRRVRASELDSHAFVIAVLDKQPAATIPAVFQAGADDFLRLPVAREELLARIEAPKRFRKWASVAAKMAAQEVSGERDLRKLGVFSNMGQIVCEDLASLVGPLEVVEGFLVSGELHGASIPMSIASERAEIRVSIVVEKRLLKTLAGILLCDENSPESAIKDMLREVANTAGGAVKRAAQLEQLAVTTGLPVDEARSTGRSEMTRCWTATITGSMAQIGIVGEVSRRANRRMALGAVQEGMVIANDLRNESGALIVPAGTRLTLATVTRLVSLLGQRFVVDVLES